MKIRTEIVYIVNGVEVSTEKKARDIVMLGIESVISTAMNNSGLKLHHKDRTKFLEELMKDSIRLESLLDAHNSPVEEF